MTRRLVTTKEVVYHFAYRELDYFSAFSSRDITYLQNFSGNMSRRRIFAYLEFDFFRKSRVER